MYYVYILRCKDGSIYTGCTKDLRDRVDRHKKGRVQATKEKRPINLVSYIALPNRYVAFKFEKYLKSGSGRAFLNKHILIKD